MNKLLIGSARVFAYGLTLYLSLCPGVSIAASELTPNPLSPATGFEHNQGSTIEFEWQLKPSVLRDVSSFDFYIYDRIESKAIYRNRTLSPSVCSTDGLCRVSIAEAASLSVGERHVWRVNAKYGRSASAYSYIWFDTTTGNATTLLASPQIENIQATGPFSAVTAASTHTTPANVSPAASIVSGTALESSSAINPKALFVSTSGHNSSSGLSETQPLGSIQSAINIATPGTTIYVKAGNYGAQTLVIGKSGSASEPITIEGYRTVPGDKPTYPSFAHNSAHNPALMPLLNGGSRTSDATAISVRADNIKVKNIQIVNYRQAVYTDNSSNIEISNIVATKLGNPAERYDGMGIFFGQGTNDSRLLGSTIVNATAQAITVAGSRNTLDGNYVYANDNSTGAQSATDYYFVLSDASGNTVSNNVIERIGDLDHVGHGYTVKGNSQNNIIESNTAINMKGGGLAARWTQAYNNVFKNNTIIGGDGILARDGAHDNLFEDNSVTGSRWGIYTLNGQEDPLNSANIAAENNVFRNITIKDVTRGVFFFSSYSRADSTTIGNIYENITVDGAPILVVGNHKTQNNLVRNSKFSNIGSFAYARSPRSTGEIDLSFENSTITDSGFVLP